MSANETTGESVTTESSTSPTNVKAVEVNGLALFNRKGEPNSLSVYWKRWERGFERSNQRRSESNVVVALGNIEVQEICYTLVPVGQDASLNACLVALDNSFTQRLNFPCTSSNAAVERRNYKSVCVPTTIIEKARDPSLRRKFLQKQVVQH